MVLPWWQGPSRRIASSPETTRSQHGEFLKHSTNSIYVYTNGSTLHSTADGGRRRELEDGRETERSAHTAIFVTLFTY
jgi:hypothetical protein